MVVRKDTKIGVIGYGVVGKAIERTLSKKFMVKKYDKFLSSDSIEDVANCDIVFISVPTPYNGLKKKIDISSIVESLDALSNLFFKGLVVIKSTIPPSTTNQMSKSYGFKLCFNPEFLRESKSPYEDFENQSVVVIGTSDKVVFRNVKSMYNAVLPKEAEYFHVTSVEAEMIKYAQNTTLASRVAIANIVYDACEILDISYSKIRNLAFDKFDILGPHMVQVPGPDGQRGFGGKCLPKDLDGFNSAFKSDVISKIISYNKSLRDDQD